MERGRADWPATDSRRKYRSFLLLILKFFAFTQQQLNSALALALAPLLCPARESQRLFRRSCLA
jgi:hypothetical protein